MLGTNDLKTEFDRSPQDIAEATDDLLNSIEQHGRYMKGDLPKVIIMSPIHIDVSAHEFKNFYSENYDDTAGGKSEALAPLIKQVADTHEVIFIDAASVAEPGIDGIHLSTDSHTPLANLVHDQVRQIQF